MIQENFQYTVAIFERLYEQMPPLVPIEVQKDMARALEQVRANMTLERAELEETMIHFGKELWPYRQAFLECYRIHEGEMGERILLQQVPLTMKKKYKEFTGKGGSFRDLHVGNSLVFFDRDERVLLCEALVATQRAVWEYTTQAVLSNEREQYEARIVEFESILYTIEEKLHYLREMASTESEHPELAAEIREHIRGFEYGFCLLGPRVDFDAVCNAEDYFQERKLHKKVHASMLSP